MCILPDWLLFTVPVTSNASRHFKSPLAMGEMPFKIKRASSVSISVVIDTGVNSNPDCTFSHLLFTPVSLILLLNIFMKEGIPMAQSSHVLHEIHPVFNTDSRILILGSFPSVKSRESQFFYGHPRNRFWDLLATLTGEPLPAGIEEKKSLLLAHHIAGWDVIASCDIEGSSDSSIHNVVPNDLSEILQTASIRQIFTNGGTAYRLYKKYCFPQTQQKAICLPSTSPANAAWSKKRLLTKWNQICPYLE